MLKKIIITVDRTIAWLLLIVIKGYRFVVSPFLGARCRFHPSCSHYGEAALQRHGAVIGGYLIVRRLLRCHPLNSGGFDPVPERLKIGKRWI